MFSYNERVPVAAGFVQESPECQGHNGCESTQVFSYNERVPAAAGLVQHKDSAECEGHNGCESTQVFSYTERHPAAAGFLQTSACHSSGIAGVTCIPHDELFATGMNGDEDLGETIKMKGDTFKYAMERAYE